MYSQIVHAVFEFRDTRRKQELPLQPRADKIDLFPKKGLDQIVGAGSSASCLEMRLRLSQRNNGNMPEKAQVDGDINVPGQNPRMRRKLPVALFIAILIKAHLLGQVRQTALASPRWCCILVLPIG